MLNREGMKIRAREEWEDNTHKVTILLLWLNGMMARAGPTEVMLLFERSTILQPPHSHPNVSHIPSDSTSTQHRSLHPLVPRQEWNANHRTRSLQNVKHTPMALDPARLPPTAIHLPQRTSTDKRMNMEEATAG